MCDDIRIESNDKYLLIGVYSGTIRLRKPSPVALPTLSFWIQMDLQKADYGSYDLRLVDPRQRRAAYFSGHARLARAEEPGPPICQTGPTTLPSYGAYSVEFGMGAPPCLLGRFAVRPSEGDAPFKATQVGYPALAGLSRQH
jgi:hypothetical protein